MGKMIDAAEFKIDCLRILDEMNETGEPVTITWQGRVVGVLNPGQTAVKGELPPLFGALKSDRYSFPDPLSPTNEAKPKRPLVFGCMKGSVTRHDDRPFDPAIEPEAWDAVRGEWEPQA